MVFFLPNHPPPGYSYFISYSTWKTGFFLSFGVPCLVLVSSGAENKRLSWLETKFLFFCIVGRGEGDLIGKYHEIQEITHTVFKYKYWENAKLKKGLERTGNNYVTSDLTASGNGRRILISKFQHVPVVIRFN